MNAHRYILTLSCPDRKGLVHAVSGFVLEHGGNMEEIAQFSDLDSGMFFMRIDFSSPQYPGEQLFLFHCHNLEHEDQGMMLNVKIA